MKAKLTWQHIGMTAIGDEYGPIYRETATMPDGRTVERRRRRGTRRGREFQVGRTVYRSIDEALAAPGDA